MPARLHARRHRRFILDRPPTYRRHAHALEREKIISACVVR
jgi:hypothetical protein